MYLTYSVAFIEMSKWVEGMCCRIFRQSIFGQKSTSQNIHSICIWLTSFIGRFYLLFLRRNGMFQIGTFSTRNGLEQQQLYQQSVWTKNPSFRSHHLKYLYIFLALWLTIYDSWFLFYFYGPSSINIIVLLWNALFHSEFHGMAKCVRFLSYQTFFLTDIQLSTHMFTAATAFMKRLSLLEKEQHASRSQFTYSLIFAIWWNQSFHRIKRWIPLYTQRAGIWMMSARVCTTQRNRYRIWCHVTRHVLDVYVSCAAFSASGISFISYVNVVCIRVFFFIFFQAIANEIEKNWGLFNCEYMCESYGKVIYFEPFFCFVATHHYLIPYAKHFVELLKWKKNESQEASPILLELEFFFWKKVKSGLGILKTWNIRSIFQCTVRCSI